MSTHCSECGTLINSVEEGRRHKREAHPITLWITIPKGLKHKITYDERDEIVVDVLDDKLPIRIIRPEQPRKTV